MPHKDLKQIHDRIMEIASEAKELTQRNYTADDIKHLQNKLHHIDEEYQQGVIDDRDNPQDDPYEHPGQAQVAEDLENLHDILHNMLTRVE